MKLNEQKITFLAKKYGANFSGVIFDFEIGKFFELSFRFDSKDNPDVFNLGHDYSFDPISTKFAASIKAQMLEAKFGEWYGGALGYYWHMESDAPIDFHGGITVPKFSNGHSIHIITHLKENYHFKNIEASINAHIFSNGNYIKEINVIKNKTLFNDRFKVNSFKVNW